MMDRINGCRDHTLSFRNVFNDTLMHVLAGRPGYFYINTDQAMGDSSFFGTDNKLNSYGCVEFWNEIDKQLEKFEERKINLKPFMSPTYNRWGSHKPKKFHKPWFKHTTDRRRQNSRDHEHSYTAERY